jgi:RHS repeat-associated protein
MFNVKPCLFSVLKQRKWKESVAVLCLLIILSLSATGQTGLGLNIKYTDNNTDQAERSSLQVDPSTLGLSFSVPLGGYPGRGLSLPVTLSYNSKVWRIKPGQIFIDISGRFFNNAFPKYAENTKAGWTISLGVPRVEYPGVENPYDENGNPQCFTCDGNSGSYYIQRLTLHMPDGSAHELRKNDTPVWVSAGQGAPTVSGDYVAVDGSRIRATLSTTQFVIYLPDGSRYVQDFVQGVLQTTQYIDRFGNTLTHNDSTKVWTDTLGRQIGLVDDSGAYAFDNTTAATRWVKLPGIWNGTYTKLTYGLVWKNLADALTPISGSNPPQYPALRYEGSRYGNPSNPQNLSPVLFDSDGYTGDGSSNWIYANQNTLFNPVVLSEIILPNELKYVFTYNEFGEVTKVMLPSGGYQYFVHSPIPPLDPDENAPSFNKANRGVTEQRICTVGACTPAQEQAFTFTSSGVATTVTDPTGTKSERYLYNGLSSIHGGLENAKFGFDDSRAGRAFEERTYKVGGQLIRRALTEWITSGPQSGGNEYANRDARAIRQIEILLDTGGDALERATTMVYDNDLNVTETKHYDYASISQATATSNLTSSVHATVNAFIESFLLGTQINTEKTLFLVNDPAYAAVQTHYRNRNLLALPTATWVENPAGATVARTEFIYDEAAYAPLANSPAAVQWTDPATSYRGTPTTVRRWSNVTYDANGNAIVNSYPSGQWLVTHTQTDVCGNVRKVWDANGNEINSNYADNFSDNNNARNTYAYPKSVTPPLGNGGANLTTTTKYDYHTGLPTQVTDPNNASTSYEYNDPLNRVTKVLRPTVGGETRYVYGDVDATLPDLCVKTITTVSLFSCADGGCLTDYVCYDGLGRSIRSVHEEEVQPIPPVNQPSNERPTVGGLRYSVRDTVYDTLGRVAQVSNPYFVENVSNLNIQVLLAATPGTVKWTQNTYDALSRVTNVLTTADGAQVVTEYAGNKVTVRDQAMKKRSSVTDALGRLTQVTEAPGVTENNIAYGYETYYSYDALNNLTRVRQGKFALANPIAPAPAQPVQFRAFFYDSLSRLVFANNPEQEATLTGPAGTFWTMKYQYDSNGNLTKRTDARNVTTTYAYDALNRNTTVDYSTTTFTPTNFPDIQRFYDTATNGKGRLQRTESYVPDPRVAANPPTLESQTVINTYDAMGRVTAQKQRIKNNGVWYEYNVTPQYDRAGNVTKLTYPANTYMDYFYDIGGRPLSVNGTLGGPFYYYANYFNYNAAGQMVRERFGTQTLLYHTNAYNERFQMTESRLGTVNNEWNRGKLTFQYGNGADNNGNLIKQEHLVPTSYSDQTGVVSASVTPMSDVYEYDALNRIRKVTGSQSGTGSPIYTQGYNYDQFGNRKIDMALTSGNNINKKVYKVNSLTNRLIGFTYDVAGNVLRDVGTVQTDVRQYDAENRMTMARVGNVTSYYVYDGDGRRVRRIVNGLETWQVYGIGGELLAEYPVNGLANAPQKEYGYRAGQLLVTAEGADVKWLVSDHLGTPRMTVGQAGTLAAVRRHDYLPFGEELTPGMGNNSPLRGAGYGYEQEGVRQKFTGKERDIETGLDYFIARYYSNVQGRFTKPDIPLLDQNPRNPQSLNLFAYVRNNPLKFSDPTGDSCYYYSGALLGCDGNKGLKVEGETLYYIDKKGKAQTADLNFVKVQEETGSGPATIGDFALQMQLRAPAIKRAIGGAALTGIGGGLTGGLGLYFGGIAAGSGFTSLGVSAWPTMTNVAGTSNPFVVLYSLSEGLPSLANSANAIVLQVGGAYTSELQALYLGQIVSRHLPVFLGSVKLVAEGSNKLSTLGKEVNFLLNNGYRLATQADGLWLIPK